MDWRQSKKNAGQGDISVRSNYPFKTDVQVSQKSTVKPHACAGAQHACAYTVS